MNVCFISRRYFPAISGMSAYAKNLLQQLVERGHRVTMVSQYRGDALGSGVYGGGPPPPVEGVEVIGLEAVGEQNGGDFEADIRAMVEAVERAHERTPFDILHAQYGYPNGLAALEAGRQLALPTVVSIQGGEGHWIGPCCSTHKATFGTVLERAESLLIGCPSFAREVQSHHGTPMDRFTFVPGAVDVTRYPPVTQGDVGNPTRLLFHGRIDERKGVLELVQSFRLLVDSGRAVSLTLSGIGPDLARAQALTTKLGLDDAVTFAGYVAYEDAPSAYGAGDIFVSPTWSEGFSNTILEAMSSGLPVVSTRAIGVVDCIEHERNGLLVEVHDVEGLAAAIGRMIDDHHLRRSVRQAALDDVNAVYSWDVVGGMIIGEYERLCGVKPDPVWPLLAELGMPVDQSCRFRATPHLL